MIFKKYIFLDVWGEIISPICPRSLTIEKGVSFGKPHRLLTENSDYAVYTLRV